MFCSHKLPHQLANLYTVIDVICALDKLQRTVLSILLLMVKGVCGRDKLRKENRLVALEE